MKINRLHSSGWYYTYKYFKVNKIHLTSSNRASDDVYDPPTTPARTHSEINRSACTKEALLLRSTWTAKWG